MIRELQSHEIILQKQLQSIDKKYQFKISKLKTDISEITNNTSEYEAKIRQKEIVKLIIISCLINSRKYQILRRKLTSSRKSPKRAILTLTSH